MYINMSMFYVSFHTMAVKLHLTLVFATSLQLNVFHFYKKLSYFISLLQCIVIFLHNMCKGHPTTVNE